MIPPAQGGPESGGATESRGVTDQLRQLVELHSDGQLTDAEFERAKTVLLEQEGDTTGAKANSPWRRHAPAILGVVGAVLAVGLMANVLLEARGPDAELVANPAPSPEEPEASRDTQSAISEPSQPTEDAPTEEADLIPADLTATDWAELEWMTTCTDVEGTQPVTLEPAGPLGWDQPGALAHQANPSASAAMPGTVYVVDTESAVYGDVTGDGLEDATLRTECFFGNGSSFLVEVWSHDHEGSPLHLPPILEYIKLDGVIETVEIVDGAVRIRTSEPAPGDDTPHLNGYPTSVVTDWRFVAGRWSPTEIERHEPPPTPVEGDYGSDPELDQLWDGCAAGDIGSCEFLFVRSPVDSRYESFGATCGGLYEDWVCVPH